jgi:hypothetical protein
MSSLSEAKGLAKGVILSEAKDLLLNRSFAAAKGVILSEAKDLFLNRSFAARRFFGPRFVPDQPFLVLT